MMLRQSFRFFLLLLAVITTGCQSTGSVNTKDNVPVAPAESRSVVPGLQTDIRTYRSTENGREYIAYVSLPMTYDVGDKSYTALYVTDGDFYTIPTAMTAGILAFGQEMPEVITVGIGYGGSAMNSLERREEDMTLEGSESFLKFLKYELIPDIEANYRVDPSVRTLMGHSLGGSFSLYSLFNAPDTFSQIIASSPSCGQACEDLETSYALFHDALPARLFLSVGELDEAILPGVELFDQTLRTRGYGVLDCELAILEGETHLSARPRAFTTGMKWVFSFSGNE